MFYFKKKIFIFFLVLFIIPNQSKTEENLINILKKGKNIIFIRHSLAPGNGDPAGFILSDCSTQRNLSKKGIIQSKKIGNFFEKNQNRENMSKRDPYSTFRAENQGFRIPKVLPIQWDHWNLQNCHIKFKMPNLGRLGRKHDR